MGRTRGQTPAHLGSNVRLSSSISLRAAGVSRKQPKLFPKAYGEKGRLSLLADARHDPHILLAFVFVFKTAIKQNERGNLTAGFQLWMPFNGSNNLYKMLGFVSQSGLGVAHFCGEQRMPFLDAQEKSN